MSIPMISDMGKAEAEAKHAQLKSLSGVMRSFSRLTQEKNALLQSSSTSSNDKNLAQLNADIEKAQRTLDELNAKQTETLASINKLQFESQESVDAKRANHALYGAVMAIHTDCEEHLKQVESLCYTDGDVIKCYYPLTERTVYQLKDVARILKIWAKTFETLAGGDDLVSEPIAELDQVDMAYQTLGDFFIKWKTWAKENGNYGLDYDWWASRLREEKAKKYKDCIPFFNEIWKRYQFEIQAIN